MRVRPYSSDVIVAVVADYYYVTPDDLTDTSNIRHLLEPRCMAYVLLREVGGFSVHAIAKTFGRDPSTITTHCKRFNRKLDDSALLQQRKAEIEETL